MEWELIATGQRELPVELTESELAERGHELGKLEGLIQIKKDARAAAMKAAKAEIDSLQAQATDLAVSLETKRADREVKTRTEGNFAGNEVRVIRLDTEEVIEERAMTADERTKLTQTGLVDSPETKRKPGKPALAVVDNEIPPEAGAAE